MENDVKEMLLSFDQMDLNDKRNELNIIMNEINMILSNSLNILNSSTELKIKNYDSNVGSLLSEDKMLTFYYEDLWNLKTNAILLSALIGELNNNQQ